MTKRLLQLSADEQLQRECYEYGFNIVSPDRKLKDKFIVPGTIIKIDDDPCELLELIEISDYKELWLVFNLVSREEVYELI